VSAGPVQLAVASSFVATAEMPIAPPRRGPPATLNEMEPDLFPDLSDPVNVKVVGDGGIAQLDETGPDQSSPTTSALISAEPD
jgi:hypothetical protein